MPLVDFSFLDRLKKIQWLALTSCMLLVLGLLLYARTLNDAFVELDDTLLILQNPAAQSFTWAHITTAFTTYDPELYIPLTFLSYQFDAMLGGLQPFFFHLHNLLDHIVNAWLLLLIAERLTGKRAVALFAALLFLIHPINVEAVAWASGRKDVLSTTFFLLSLLLYLRFVRKNDSLSYATSLVAFLLGLFAKVTVVSLPIVLLIIDWYEGRKITRRSLLEKIPFLGLAMIFGIVALYGKIDAPHLSLLTRLLVSAKSFVFSVGKIFWPVGLSPMYGYVGSLTLNSPGLSLSLLVVTLLFAITFLLRRRWKAFAAGLACTAVLYAPSFGNLVKNGDYYLGSDRYSYIPAMAIFLGLGLALEGIRRSLSKRSTPGIARASVLSLGLLLMITLSVVTLRQESVWADTGTLSRYVVSVTPQARLGHLWYGNALRDEGKLDEAFVQYTLALTQKNDAQVLYNRALAWEAKGDTEKAMNDYTEALKLEPDYPLAHINLGRLLYFQGKKEEARVHFEAAAKAPQLAMPLYNLGVLEGEQKNFAKAAEYYRQALQRDPTLTDARANLAIALLELGKTVEAVVELKETVRQDPQNPTALGLRQKLIDAGIIKTGK